MDIAAWLRALGLERYVAAFEANDIDAAVLRTLNADDLKELGVTSLGHRKKLLEATAALAPPAAPGPDTPAATSAAPIGRPEAERRQLTVMFVDLVGSTALSARLDPEDMRTVIGGYQNVCSEVIRRYEGHVAKFMGDGVLAYFGYPQAHEDDAERAVRAGLDLAKAVGEQTPSDGVNLAARVGIATGQVVVGDLIGEGPAQEEAVVGETPNLAARLQGLAEPGSVVISRRTRRLVGGLFDLEDLGARDLKGFVEPVSAFRVLGASRAEGRFQALRGTGLTPLVGREQELRLLLDLWQQAKSGEAQVVLLCGEPGIGKSRIGQTVCEQIQSEPHTRLRYYCFPFFTNTAFYPLIEQLARAAGFEREDTADSKLDKLEAILSQGTESVRDAAALLAPALSIPTGDRYPPLNLSPQRQKQRTFEVLIEQLEGLAAAQPVLMIFEDAHWIDPTTQELFDLVVERVQALPVLLLMTFRPEYRPAWIGFPHVTSLTLNRLARRQGAAMAEEVAGGKALPADVLDHIVTKTDGVPLFVEELTKALIETGFLREESDHHVLAGPMPTLAIPSTLHDSLMARLDRLVPTKEIAQIAAVIGREFSYELLAEVSPLNEDELRRALAELVNSELVFPRGIPPDATYTFKHALVQDAAYSSLLRSSREDLHKRIARALEERLPDALAQQPELIAHHYSEARLFDHAVGYWLEAGRQAARRSANAEALVHLGRGLEAIQELPGTAENRQQELELLSVLAVVLRIAKGYGSDELMQALNRARVLCKEFGTKRQLFGILFGLWAAAAGHADWAGCRRLGKECLDLAADEDDPGLTVEAHRLLGATSVYVGDFEASRQHLQEALDLYDFDRDHGHVLLYGFDPGTTCNGYISWPLWHLGHVDQALDRSRDSEALAERSDHPINRALALGWAIFLRTAMRDLPMVDALSQRLIEHCTEHAFPHWLALGRIGRGWMLSQRGSPEGIALLRQGIEEFRALWGGFFVSAWLVLLADALRVAGDVRAALDAIDQSLGMIARSNERLWEAEAHRLRGDLLIASKKTSSAGAAFAQAIGIARMQKAKSLELRAALSFARLSIAEGKRADGRDLLVPVYGWFTEGFDTTDLKDAKALLDALS